jgi:predicted nuclease of predicted toxin-antitoxin system
MRVLLDECVPRKFGRELPGHEVSTVPKEKLKGSRDDILLAAAAARFDVFVTVDRNLQFQQSLAQLPMPVVVLHAISNRLAHLKSLAPELLQLLNHFRTPRVYHVPEPDAE